MISDDYTSTAKMLDETFGSTIFSTQQRFKDPLGELATNVAINRGLKYLKQRDEPAWCATLLADLSNTQVNPDPILGELRAYGELSSAGFVVAPRPRSAGAPSRDFDVRLRDGTRLNVEVATKDWDTRERRVHEKFSADVRAEAEKTTKAILIREHSIAPFGSPDLSKPGDSVTANGIQRLCGVKGKEHQWKVDEINILYLDLSRPGPFPLVSIDASRPLRSWNEHLQSGELFAAFYGSLGMPIYDNRPINYGAGGMTRMGHPGRFRLPGCKLSAAVIACRDGLAVFENPWAAAPLTKEVRRQFLLCHSAQLEFFWSSFTGREALEERIKAGIDLLAHFADIGEY